jgi:hypothetical protein
LHLTCSPSLLSFLPPSFPSSLPSIHAGDGTQGLMQTMQVLYYQVTSQAPVAHILCFCLFVCGTGVSTHAC